MFADVWIWTAYLWRRKQPLYQRSHTTALRLGIIVEIVVATSRPGPARLGNFRLQMLARDQWKDSSMD